MKLELRKMIVLATMVAGSLGIVGEGFGQITQVTGSPQTANTMTTTLTIAKPSGLVVGDVMIANIMQNDNDNDNLSNAIRTGWAVIDGRKIGETGVVAEPYHWNGEQT
ncbi:MAG: hypothetical protein IPH04_19135 [Saprospirales bacterium]|nr:hypothetical protein [Saprospirales bacterium]